MTNPDETPTPPAPLSADEQADLWALEDGISPRPWQDAVSGDGFLMIHDARGLTDEVSWVAGFGDMEATGRTDHRNAAYIAALVNAAPALRATLAAQAAEIARLRVALTREQEDERLLLESLSTRDGDVVERDAEIERLRAEAADLYDEARTSRDMLYAGGVRWAGKPTRYPDNPYRDPPAGAAPDRTKGR